MKLHRQSRKKILKLKFKLQVYKIVISFKWVMFWKIGCITGSSYLEFEIFLCKFWDRFGGFVKKSDIPIYTLYVLMYQWTCICTVFIYMRVFVHLYTFISIYLSVFASSYKYLSIYSNVYDHCLYFYIKFICLFLLLIIHCINISNIFVPCFSFYINMFKCTYNLL